MLISALPYKITTSINNRSQTINPSYKYKYKYKYNNKYKHKHRLNNLTNVLNLRCSNNPYLSYPFLF